MMERIVYLDRSALRTAVRRPAFEHEWIEYPTTRPEEVKARLKCATIAITHRVFLKGDNLPPTLRLIAVGSTGYERIDLAACRGPRDPRRQCPCLERSHRTWPGPARGRWPTWRNDSSKTSKRLCAIAANLAWIPILKKKPNKIA